MKVKNKTRAKLMYGWGFFLLILGLILNYFNIGSPEFKIFGGIGNWLVYIGFISLIMATIKVLIKKNKKVVDERMEFIAAKALRITFVFLLISSFFIIIIDGISTINISYHLFMSYMVCFLLMIYVISYKLLLRYH